MDLVEEEDRAATVVAESPIRGGQDLADSRHADRGRVLSFEVRVEGFGDQHREGRLSGTGGAMEDDRSHHAGIHHSSEDGAIPQEMILPEDFVQRARAQAMRQRTCRVAIPVPAFVPKIVHAEMVVAEAIRTVGIGGVETGSERSVERGLPMMKATSPPISRVSALDRGRPNSMGRLPSWNPSLEVATTRVLFGRCTS